MWKFFSLAFFTASLLHAQPIRDFLLDPTRSVDLPISREITTVIFPGALTAVAGADMLIDRGKAAIEVEEESAVRFHVTHAPGSNFILIRSLQPGAAGRLTAIFEGSAYVLQLQSVEGDSVASAIFKRADAQTAARVESVPEVVKFSPRIGLSLLDRARAYPFLVKALPKAVEGISQRTPNRIIGLPEIEITVQEIYRFSKEDAVVFLLKLRNTTDSVIDIAPNTFAARIVQERFEQSIANGPRVLQPGEIAEAEFAIVGLPDGTRNDLSVDNAFTILVNCARRPTQLSMTPVVQREVARR